MNMFQALAQLVEKAGYKGRVAIARKLPSLNYDIFVRDVATPEEVKAQSRDVRCEAVCEIARNLSNLRDVPLVLDIAISGSWTRRMFVPVHREGLRSGKLEPSTNGNAVEYDCLAT